MVEILRSFAPPSQKTFAICHLPSDRNGVLRLPDSVHRDCYSYSQSSARNRHVKIHKDHLHCESQRDSSQTVHLLSAICHLPCSAIGDRLWSATSRFSSLRIAM